jgi:predicted transcriptional regulator
LFGIEITRLAVLGKRISWALRAQDSILLQLAGGDQPVLQLSAAEEASFEESLAQADRGEFATDEQVRAIWAKHNP